MNDLHLSEGIKAKKMPRAIGAFTILSVKN
jgi:hypothetical protein